MASFGEKLKAARIEKGMEQAEVANLVECTLKSLRDFENGYGRLSLDIVSGLCELYGVEPLRLLSKEYTYKDIAMIAIKPISERTYEETIALNFSGPILDKTSSLRASEGEPAVDVLRDLNPMVRFGGMADEKQMDALRAEYEANGGADADILFAYHMMNLKDKVAFLSMLHGLFSAAENILRLDGGEAARKYTCIKIRSQIRELREERETE